MNESNKKRATTEPTPFKTNSSEFAPLGTPDSVRSFINPRDDQEWEMTRSRIKTMKEVHKPSTINMYEMSAALEKCTSKLKSVGEWTTTTEKLYATAKEQQDRIKILKRRIDASEEAISGKIDAVSQDI